MTVQTRSMTKRANLDVVNPVNKTDSDIDKKSDYPEILGVICDETIPSNKTCAEVVFKNLKTGKIKSPNNPKPIVDVLSTKELEEKGLSPYCLVNGFLKVVPFSELDILVTLDKDVNDKWVVAPEGWQWKKYSEKCYFWFDWYELEPIKKIN